MGDPIGPYYVGTKNWMVHTYCALFSPNVFKRGPSGKEQVIGVVKELKRA